MYFWEGVALRGAEQAGFRAQEGGIKQGSIWEAGTREKPSWPLIRVTGLDIPGPFRNLGNERLRNTRPRRNATQCLEKVKDRNIILKGCHSGIKTKESQTKLKL